MKLIIYLKNSESFHKTIEIKSIDKITYLSDIDGSVIQITDFSIPFLQKSREFTFVGESTVTVPTEHINFVEFKQQ